MRVATDTIKLAARWAWDVLDAEKATVPQNVKEKKKSLESALFSEKHTLRTTVNMHAVLRNLKLQAELKAQRN